jgi:hypothetical protein
MKKIFFLLFISFAIFPLCVYADDVHEKSVSEESALDEDDSSLSEDKGPSRRHNRVVEVGFLNMNFGFGNSFLTFSEIFQKTLVINLDELESGFGANFGLFISPIHFNYNKDDQWGFGISTGVEAAGIIGLSGKMLTFSEASNEKSDVSGAAFAEAAFPVFFHVEKFKFKIKPSLYYTIMYVEPDISYTYKTTSGDTPATVLDLDFNIRIFTAAMFNELPDKFDLTATPGVDITIGAEYPLSAEIGLKDKHDFLDFDVGLDFVNIPLVPSVMKAYMEMTGRIGGKEPLDFLNGMDMDSFIEFSDITYHDGEKMLHRPFKMLAWADWRPFETKAVSFIPTLGFSVSPFYSQPVSLEAGIKARYDLLNTFIASFEIGYQDRIWKNGLDIALNFRAVEFDIGINLQSPDFVKSWSGGGLGLNIGFKFGW